jgi:membrane-associated phospholipid phosphatase
MADLSGLKAAAVPAFAAVATGAWVMAAGPIPGEEWILVGIHDAGGGPIDRVMLVTSRLTDLVSLGVVAVGVLAALLVSHRRMDAAFFVGAVAVVWAVNPVLKEIVGRARPDLWPLPESVSDHSFPSGHAANTAALAGALVMILRGRLVATLVAATALMVVGLSQLVLGRHYPSDILAGWLWAGAWIIVLGSAFEASARPTSGAR